MRDKVRRNMPLFPMGIITQLTELTPRQIRYYEQQGLVFPSRTKGNQRLFSFNDVDRLLTIKDWLDKGLNIAGVKEVLNKTSEAETVVRLKKEVSEKDLLQMLRKQLITPARPGQANLIQGELSRFFRN